MAERSVSVKLSARVESYIAAMKSAQAATAGVATSGTRDLSRLGGQLQTFGRAATMGVTVPLVALGAGAVAMAAKFDTAFAQMVGLANVPASEVDGLKESVLALAGETAQAPQDLAEALYFAASAGLDSAGAMDAVELAARGAAAGMGSAQDIVGLTASAVASYGDANISAAEATDILTATIREGRAEPAELAATLGRVLPIASQMGITFAEVGGATAYLTNIMGGADVSTTALRDALMKLSAPGQAAKDALVEMGTSFGELQSAISQDGLLGALDLLRTHGFAGNAEALHALVPDAQGYLALTALLNDESGQLAGTIDAVTNSAGSLDMAFGAVSETSGFKMKQAVTDIKIAMIEVGDVLLPIAAKVASAIADIAGWFNDLSPTVQTVVVAFAGLAAAVGPVVFIAGSFIKNLKQINSALSLIGPGASKASLAMAGIGAAITLGFIGYQMFTKQQRETDEVTRNVSDALDGQIASLFGAAGAADTTTTSIDGLAIANEALNLALAEGNEKLSDALAALNVSGSQTLDVLGLFGDMSGDLTTGLDFLARSYGLTAEQADLFATKLFAMARSALPQTRAEALQLAEAAGITEADFNALTGATVDFMNAADDTDLQAIAREFLNGRVQAEGYEGSLVALAEKNLHMNRATGDAIAIYHEWARIVGESDAATMAAAAGAGELTAATTAAGDAVEGAVGKFGKFPSALDAAALSFDGIAQSGMKAEEVIGKFGDLGQPVAGLFDAIAQGGEKVEDAWRKSDEMFSDLGAAASDAAGGFQELEDAVNDLWDAFDNIMNPADDLRSAARDVNVAIEAISDAMVDNVDASDDMAGGFDITTEAGRTAEEAYIAARDAIYEHGHQMMLNGATATEAAYDIEYNTRSLHDNMIAAGFTEEQIRNLNGEYFLTPSELKTQLETIGVAQAAAEIAHHKSNLNTIPRYQPTTVTVAVDENAIGKVNSRLANIVNQVRTAYIGVTGPGTKAGGGFNKYALGAYIPRPEFAMLHGNEAVLPLDNPPRMRELVADRRIGDPLMAALSGISEVGPRGSASLGNITPAPNGMNGGGNTSVINVAVNMPPGSDGDDVVRALKQWQRRSGPLPLAVR